MKLAALPRPSPTNPPALGPAAGEFRLSLLLALVYAAPGAFVPLFSLRLTELGFSPIAIGWCCATQAFGSLIAPLLAGQVADRWLPAQRCLTVLALIEGVLLWILADLRSPASVFGVSLLCWLVLTPAFTLSTTVCFAHLAQPARQFGRVRLWGTVGWVAPGWLLGIWLSNAPWLQPLLDALLPHRPFGQIADAFKLASVLAFMFAAYSLTLPHTPPQRRGQGLLAPLAAIRILWGKAFAVYAVCTLGICIVLPFYTQAAPLLLAHLGVRAGWLPRVLTIAQASEVVTLAMLPVLLGRFGTRSTMLLGIVAILLTLAGFMAAQPIGLVIAGLAWYGVCIACFLVAGQVFLNHVAGDAVRASAQALHSWLCGFGLLIGNLLVGFVRSQFHLSFSPTFAVGAGIAAVILAVFWIGFPKSGEV